LIKIQNILTLAVIISLILPLQYNTLKYSNGEMNTDSQLVMYDNMNSKNPFLADSKNTIIKPNIHVSIEGTPNDDQLKGGDGGDKIRGEDGDDTLSGVKGNDKITGEKGDDLINGGLGNDTLDGGNGDDKVSGESENDLIEGGKGDDTLFGGKGDDGILGDEGNDVLNGGEGADMMSGGLGIDSFICDSWDIIVDFNSNEGDKTLGECSPQDQTANETSSEDIPLEASQSTSSQLLQNNNNNNNIPMEDFTPGPPPSFNIKNIPMEELKSPPPPPPPAAFSHNGIPSEEDFGSFPPIPLPRSNEKYMSAPSFN
jgi:Ca2+-binding RTX toxin-like protein